MNNAELIDLLRMAMALAGIAFVVFAWRGRKREGKVSAYYRIHFIGIALILGSVALMFFLH